MSNAAQSMSNPIAVTGSTGHVGRLTAELLAEAGHALRLPARNPDRSPRLPGAVSIPFSYSDKPASVAALQGARMLFMVSAAEAEDRLSQHLNFVDAAQEAGIRHVVYTSFLAAAEDAIFTLGRDHWATEQHIRRSGLEFTFLRDNIYLDFLPLLAGGDGVIRGPAGDGAVSAVARADVARVAAVVLQNPGAHAGQTYDLTGPAALTLQEAAAIITEETGNPVRYQAETVDEAYASRRHFGVPDWQLDAWVSSYTAIASGELARTTTAVQDVTGRAPVSLTGFLQGGTR